MQKSEVGEQQSSPEQNIPFLAHLQELRKRLGWILLSLCVGFGVCFYFSEQLFEIFRNPILPFLKTETGAQASLVYLSVGEKFATHMRLALITGAMLSFPFWAYQLWLFICPALYRHEKKMIVLFLLFGTTLFICGLAFAYFVALPAAYEFLLAFGGQQDLPMISVSEHVHFLTTMMLIFGIVFETPLVLSLLAVFGLVTADQLSKGRRYAIVINSILAAVFSPPDILSMLIVFVPLTILYELAIIVIRVFLSRKQPQSV